VSTLDPRTPLPLEPKLTTAIWGGDALVRRYGKPGDPNALLGESWECWDENRITGGAFAGRTLAEVREQLGAQLLGPVDSHARFPVLTKLIDARAALSVQVHPDDAYAQRIEGEPFGKTECWYILDAAPGAELVLGWSHDTSRDEVERRIADGTLGAILRRVVVHAGETYYLPAGTLHAIGAGIQLFEAQQASDLTYRLFDWNRVGADGKPRQLHVAKAADVLDYHAVASGAVVPMRLAGMGCERSLLVADPRFALERVQVAAASASLATNGRALVVLAAGAPLRLIAGEGLELAAWQTAVIPACAGQVGLEAAPGGAVVLATRVVPDLDRLAADAIAGGATASEANQFFAAFRPADDAVPHASGQARTATTTVPPAARPGTTPR
jgi:mannose-6-phosphate isomerase